MHHGGIRKRSKFFSRYGTNRIALCCALLLARCSGSSGGASTASDGMPVAANASQDATAPVEINLIVPPRIAAQAAGRPGDPQLSAKRSPRYVSPSSLSLSVTVTAQNGSVSQTHVFPCSTAACSASFRAPVGQDTMALTLTDDPTGNGKKLSLSSATPVVISAIGTNIVNLTANPVVARAAVAVGTGGTASTSVPGGTAADVPVNVLAYDSDGNLIVGPGDYVDASGNPVTFNVSLRNNNAGGAGAVSLSGGAAFTTSAAAKLSAHYNGLWYDHADFVATSSTALIPISSGVLTSVPTAKIYTTGISANAYPWEITPGPDGALWFGETGHGTIGRITTSGAVTEFSAGITPGANNIYGLSAGPDGNIWFIEYIARRVGRITPSGTVTEFGGMTAFQPVGIAPGPDGNMWFTEQLGSKIGYITPSGAITDFSSTGVSPRAVVTGPDGNVWVGYGTSYFTSRVDAGHAFTDFAYPPTFNSGPGYYFKMAVGPDGNIWFPNRESSAICRYSFATSSVTAFTTGISFHAGIRSVTAGPDGNVWFSESDIGKVGRITPDGTVTEYGVANGILPGSFPLGIALGSDGNIWVSLAYQNAIAKIVL